MQVAVTGIVPAIDVEGPTDAAPLDEDGSQDEEDVRAPVLTAP